MARAKKKAKKAAKKAVKTTAAKRAKAPARKAKKIAAKRAKAPARKTAKAPRKAAAKKAVKKTAKKTSTRRGGDVKGEGNYSASRRFRKNEEGFIKRMGKKIVSLGQEAKAALTGPEGKDLEAAEASSRARGAGMDTETE